MSPGCKADGAEGTLAEMQALAPPGVCIEEGGCVSQCGKGPIVTTTTTKTATTTTDSESKKIPKNRKSKEDVIIYKRVSDETIVLELLPTIMEELVEGYRIVQKAKEFFDASQYEEAIDLYEKGLDLALQPAMDMHMPKNDEEKNRDNDDGVVVDSVVFAVPVGMHWIIRTCHEMTQSYLALRRKDEALISAQRAIEISKQSDATSYQYLAKVYAEMKNDYGEYDALQNMFDLEPLGTPGLSAVISNQRRTLSFRWNKLQREIALKNNNN